jgi:hypothetical protein
MSGSKSRGGVVASDGGNGRLSPETITDLGIKHGVFRKDERASVVARAKADPGGVLTAVCRGLRPAGAVTPPTTSTAVSGPAVAAGSRPTSDYPPSWAPTVAASGRLPGVRAAAARAARSAVRRVTGDVHAAGSGPAFAARVRAEAEQVTQQAQANVNGFYDKSPKPSAHAAAQEAARVADLERMAAEQAARGIG